LPAPPALARGTRAAAPASPAAAAPAPSDRDSLDQPRLAAAAPTGPRTARRPRRRLRAEPRLRRRPRGDRPRPRRPRLPPRRHARGAGRARYDLESAPPLHGKDPRRTPSRRRVLGGRRGNCPFLPYEWPGNVRELASVIERATILARGDRLAIDAVVPKPER